MKEDSDERANYLLIYNTPDKGINIDEQDDKTIREIEEFLFDNKITQLFVIYKYTGKITPKYRLE